MGNIFSSGKETTPRKENATSSPYSPYRTHNTGQAIFTTNSREKKENSGYRYTIDNDAILALYQARKASGVKENTPSLLYRSAVPERKTTSRVNENATLLSVRAKSERKTTSRVNENATLLSDRAKSERKTTSGVKGSTTSLPHRSISERKMTSGVKENANLLSYRNIAAVSERKMTSGVKENTTIPRRPYSIATSERKTTSGVKENTTSLLNHPYSIATFTTTGVKENTASLPHRPYSTATMPGRKTKMEDTKKITEIVNHLLAQNKYRTVYGNWSCPKWPESCENEDEWQTLFTWDSFQKYLNLTPEKQYDFFMRPCKECNSKSLVSSFFLYTNQPRYSQEPTVEIVRHLEWKGHYRVFADWKCKHPQHPHRWKSSYTWISLEKFIEKTPGRSLNRDDFYMQKCYDCKDACNRCSKAWKGCEECKKVRSKLCDKCKQKRNKSKGCAMCDFESIILNYSPLVQSSGGKPHKRDLCAKCQEGAICVRTDNNYHVRQNRNIKLGSIYDNDFMMTFYN